MKKTQSATPQQPGVFRFREVGGKVLVTNDAGDSIFLSRDDFALLTAGKLDDSHDKFLDLKSMGAVLDRGRLPRALAERYRLKKDYLTQGPLLFILVATLRCNMKCAYCHAGALGPRRSDLDMDEPTARRVVDTIFAAPGINLSIEFQGGEPLLNWDTVRFIADYAIEANTREGRNLFLNLVSNLSLLDDEKIDFLVSRKIGLCTSLDGPEALHNANRGGGYRQTVRNLQKAMRRYKVEFDRYTPAALATVTRGSLSMHREIIDTYAKLGLSSIHLRPINPIGFAQPILDRIGYSAAEFLDFYSRALEYIIELNRGGTFLIDRTAWLFLMKIFGRFDPNYLDLRSPCGAGIGQIAFNYNGDVYTCDEGRMLAMAGDETFRMGNVFDQSYDDLVSSEIVKQTCLASIIEGIPHCDNCAYNPYCGVCPLLNYVEEGSLFARMPENRRHIINEGILDLLFSKLQDDATKDIFMSWIERGINIV